MKHENTVWHWTAQYKTLIPLYKAITEDLGWRLPQTPYCDQLLYFPTKVKKERSVVTESVENTCIIDESTSQSNSNKCGGGVWICKFFARIVGMLHVVVTVMKGETVCVELWLITGPLFVLQVTVTLFLCLSGFRISPCIAVTPSNNPSLFLSQCRLFFFTWVGFIC